MNAAITASKTMLANDIVIKKTIPIARLKAILKIDRRSGGGM
jgi:hypothetical protein